MKKKKIFTLWSEGASVDLLIEYSKDDYKIVGCSLMHLFSDLRYANHLLANRKDIFKNKEVFIKENHLFV
jgi:hypothetical protein